MFGAVGSQLGVLQLGQLFGDAGPVEPVEPERLEVGFGSYVHRQAVGNGSAVSSQKRGHGSSQARGTLGSGSVE